MLLVWRVEESVLTGARGNVKTYAATTEAKASVRLIVPVLDAHTSGWRETLLNTLIEQDHRFIKRLVKPGLGFFSFETAGRTLQGYEVMNIIRKGQIRGVSKGDSRGQVAFIASLFGVAS